MSKNKYSLEQKIKACQEYITGQKSALQLAEELSMGKGGENTVSTWARMFIANGPSAFSESGEKRSYSKELKIKVVNEYLTGKASLRDLAVKYNIRDKKTIRSWIMNYNSHIELKDYDPKPEAYMTDTLKTTLDERIKIVKACLEHDRDIKSTAVKYGCNYAQLYQWIRKYEANGEDALIDKRGKKKQETELSELEKAERKIAQLEREKEEYRKKYELLKKAEERERW